MTPLLERAFSLLDSALLHGAAAIVPHANRSEWRREWQSELWHVRQACGRKGTCTWRGEWEVARFCRGAMQDAWYLRREALRAGSAAPHPSVLPVVLRGSAMKVIAVLAASLAVTYGLAALLPGVRAQTEASRYQVRPGVIFIQDMRIADDEQPTITAERFRAWKMRTQRYFDGMAFYRVSGERMSAGAAKAFRLQVAHASPGLFTLLGLPLAAENGTDGGVPAVVLSSAVWKRDLQADPDVVGTLVTIGAQAARVVAVAPDGAWRLPGQADAWLLQPDGAASGTGYVVAHLNDRGRAEMAGNRVGITSNDAEDGEDNLCGVSFTERMLRPRDIFLFALFLALLALPAITSVSMGEYSFNAHGSDWRRKLARWSFLITKMALLVPAAYCISLDLAYGATVGYSPAAVYLQLASSFLLCLFGLRWVMLDQRQRCPVCLCKVTHPAQVGQAGQTFLAWNGTEMMCRGGHTLLHVPGMPTSWFSTQRWIYLDRSWQFLFAGTEAG